MKTLLVAYHSQSGASARLAMAAAAGARACEDIQVQCGRCSDLGSRDLARADALLLVCAENNGRLNGGAKDFLDRIFYPAVDKARVLPYALLVSAGSDGEGAVGEAHRIFKGIPFTQATEPQIIHGPPGPTELDAARQFGEALATGVSMAIF
ncbi:MAG: flavodoxin [Chromatocurvus sp.]